MLAKTANRSSERLAVFASFIDESFYYLWKDYSLNSMRKNSTALSL